MNTRHLFSILLLSAGMCSAQTQPDTFHLRLASGEEVSVQGQLLTPRFDGWAVHVNDTLTYPLRDLVGFRQSAGEFLRIEGSSRVARLLTVGVVNLYQKHPNDSLTLEGSFPLEPIRYFSKNGSLAQVADYDHLSEALADNYRSSACFRSYRTWDYFKFGSAAVALGLFSVEVIQAKKVEPIGVPLLVSAVVCAGIALLSHDAQQRALRDALQEYNTVDH